MAYEDVIINTLMRALEAKNLEQVSEGAEAAKPEHAKPSTCNAGNEHDRQWLESGASLDAPRSGFRRLLDRVFGRP